MNHSELRGKLQRMAIECGARLRGDDWWFDDGALENFYRFARAADSLQAMEPSESDKTADNDKVICPECCSQFTAIPVNVQARLQALERVPMTEREIIKLLAWSNIAGTVKMTYESGPYDIDVPTVSAMRLVSAIEAHHNIHHRRASDEAGDN